MRHEVNELCSKLDQFYKNVDGIYCDTLSQEGSWSNLNRKEQAILFNQPKSATDQDAVQKLFQNLENIMFDPMRLVGLKLLDIRKSDVGVDYGCNWGNLLIYAAKHCNTMLGIEQDIIKLKLLQKRIEEEGIKNISLINSNIQSSINLDDVFDFAIINGTTELIDEGHLKVRQIMFLKKVLRSLKKGGKLFLAANNKMYYRFIMSTIWPFQNNRHLYSYRGYIKLLNEAGFKNVKTYAVFPNYEFPLKILPLWKNINFNYAPVYMRRSKRTIANKVIGRIQTHLDLIVFKKLKLFNLSPSFIFIAIPA